MIASSKSTDDEHPLDSAKAGRSAVRGSALLSSGYVAGLALSLASAPLLVRHLGLADLGRYTAVISIVAIVVGLTEGGIGSIALREYSSLAGDERALTMRDLIGLRLALSVLAAAIAAGLSAALGYPQILVLGALAAACGQMLQLFQAFLGTSLQANLKFGWITALEFAGQLVTVTFIIVLVVTGAGLFAFFLVPAAAAVVTLPAMLHVTRGLMPRRPRFRASRWWTLTKRTVPFAMAIAASVIYFRVAVIATSLLSSRSQTSDFSASFRVVEVLVMVPSLIAGAGFPIIARAAAQENDERLDYAAGRLMESLVVLGVYLSLSLVLGASVVISLLGGKDFSHSVPILRVQGLALIGTCIAAGAGYVLLALHRHSAILLANLVALAASITASLLLIPALGAEGAAFAAVLAELSLAGAAITLLLRSRASLGAAIAQRTLLIVGLGALATGAALLPGLPALAAWAIGSAIFAGLLAVTGHIPPELGQLLRRSPAQSG